MWAYESVFYQIYPLGFCGAPFENDGVLTHRILKVNDWIEHIKNLGANAIYFSPVFESDTHGYNTRDYKKIDCRLGTNDDFKEVCENLHKNNIKVVLDAYSTTSDEDFGHFRTFSKTGRTHVTAIGFSLISTVIQITMMVFGTKAGRVISIL